MSELLKEKCFSTNMWKRVGYWLEGPGFDFRKRERNFL